MQNAMRLQGIGWCKTMTVSELKPGMTMYYNYGYTYEVVSIRPAGTQSVWVEVRSTVTGQTYNTVKRNSSRVVAK